MNFYFHADYQCTSSTIGRSRSVLCGGSLSVDSFNLNNSLTYYPNPVNNNLTLKEQHAIQDVSVYNMLGQEVLRTVLNAVSGEVDMSQLNTGTYFVKVTVENTIKTIKVIKK